MLASRARLARRTRRDHAGAGRCRRSRCGAASATFRRGSRRSTDRVLPDLLPSLEPERLRPDDPRGDRCRPAAALLERGDGHDARESGGARHPELLRALCQASRRDRAHRRRVPALRRQGDRTGARPRAGCHADLRPDRLTRRRRLRCRWEARGRLPRPISARAGRRATAGLARAAGTAARSGAGDLGRVVHAARSHRPRARADARGRGRLQHDGTRALGGSRGPRPARRARMGWAPPELSYRTAAAAL